jgi:hypothetical protein
MTEDIADLTAERLGSVQGEQPKQAVTCNRPGGSGRPDPIFHHAPQTSNESEGPPWPLARRNPAPDRHP